MGSYSILQKLLQRSAWTSSNQDMYAFERMEKNLRESNADVEFYEKLLRRCRTCWGIERDLFDPVKASASSPTSSIIIRGDSGSLESSRPLSHKRDSSRDSFSEDSPSNKGSVLGKGGSKKSALFSWRLWKSQDGNGDK